MRTRWTAGAEVLRGLYEAESLTLEEISARYGVGVSTVMRAMESHGIPRRGYQDMLKKRGEKNGNWRGEGIKYSAGHKRVVKARGNPQGCEKCGRNDSGGHYQWASINHQYHDPNDYVRLCCKCHNNWDKERRRA